MKPNLGEVTLYSLLRVKLYPSWGSTLNQWTALLRYFQSERELGRVREERERERERERECVWDCVCVPACLHACCDVMCVVYVQHNFLACITPTIVANGMHTEYE